MTQLALNLTNLTTCKSCDGETKPDEWANYNMKLCIDCCDEAEADARQDYEQRKSDIVISG